MRWIVSLLLACTTLSAVEPFIELDGRFYDFRKGGGVSVWWPFYSGDDSLFFSQVHSGYYRKRLVALSYGVGYRRLQSCKWGWGVNAFADYSHSQTDINYYQGGVGVEAFGPCWIVRANGYIPRLRQHVIERRGEVVGTSVVTASLFENSYGGFDIEAGYSRPMCHGEVWLYAGYYYFDTNHFKAIQGPKVRGEYRLFDPMGLCGLEFAISGQWEYDRLHKNEGALILQLRVPFSYRKRYCRSTVRGICRRFGDMVRRENSIYVERERCRDNCPLAGILFASGFGAGPMGLAATDYPTASGAQHDPTSLEDALARSGDGDIIFLLSGPERGELVAPIKLKYGQQLVGFGDAASQVISLADGMIVSVNKFDLDGTRGTVQLPEGASIELASGCVVKGIFVCDTVGSEAPLIRGDAVSNVRLFDVHIETSGLGEAAGIELLDAREITIAGCTLYSDQSPLSLRRTRGDIEIRDCRFAHVNEETRSVAITEHIHGDILLHRNHFTANQMHPINNGVLCHLIASSDFEVTFRENQFEDTRDDLLTVLTTPPVVGEPLVGQLDGAFVLDRNRLVSRYDVHMVDAELNEIAGQCHFTICDNAHFGETEDPTESVRIISQHDGPAIDVEIMNNTITDDQVLILTQ